MAKTTSSAETAVSEQQLLPSQGLFSHSRLNRPAGRKIRSRIPLSLTVLNAMMELGACVSLLEECRPWCRQVHLTRDFSHAPCTCDHTHIVAQGVSGAHSFHLHAMHDITCLSVCCLSSFCLPSLYLVPLPFLFHCLPVL